MLFWVGEVQCINFLALENVVEQCWVAIDDVHVRVRETTQHFAVILRQALKARRVVDGVQASTIFEFELDNVVATLGRVSLDAFQKDHVAIPSLLFFLRTIRLGLGVEDEFR